VGRVLNDVTVGQYDVVMETGPGYDSKRQESVASMMQIIGADPTLMKTAGDLMFRNMDFPGADVIADRLAAVNPLAQIEKNDDIPPVVQMKLKQAEEQVKQMTQKMQAMEMAMKQRSDIEQVKQDAETKRTLIKETNRGHQIELEDAAKRYDTELRTSTQAHDTVLKTQTQIEIEQMKAEIAIRLARMDDLSLKAASAETVERAV
jgi:hypothetical protein